MDLQKLIDARVKARRQILFSREDAVLEPVARQLESCSRREAVCWALTLAEETVRLLEERYPGDHRARQALELSWAWARGKVKMPIAKQAILACHAAAKELESPEDIALYHAVGQACGTVHTKGHAMGYPIYDLTALLRRCGSDNCEARIAARIGDYLDVFRNLDAVLDENHCWAAFLR